MTFVYVAIAAWLALAAVLAATDRDEIPADSWRDRIASALLWPLAFAVIIKEMIAEPPTDRPH